MRSGERATQMSRKTCTKAMLHLKASLLLMTPYLKLYHLGSTKRHSRVRRETAVIGGFYTIVLLIELEHFVGVPSVRLEGEGECFKAQQGKQ